MTRGFIILFSLATIFLGVACKREAQPERRIAPKPSTVLHQIVDALRNDPRSRHPSMLLVPEQAVIGSLPHALPADYFSKEHKDTPDKLAIHINNLIEGQLGTPWDSEMVKEINANFPPDTEYRFTVSEPIQIEKGKSKPWYSLVEEFRMFGEEPRPLFKQIGVFTFHLEGDKLIDPEWEPFLSSSRVITTPR